MIFPTELDAERLADIRQAARDAGLSNITVIEGSVSRTNLPDACCDALFSRLVYHHLTDPMAITADIFRALPSRWALRHRPDHASSGL